MKGRAAVDISGQWSVYLDPDDQGLMQSWNRNLPEEPSGLIDLPGCLQAQGFGEPPGVETQWIGMKSDSTLDPAKEYPRYAGTDEEFKFPYWLQPDLRFTGPAWYVRDVHIPARWADLSVRLRLERAHWETTVWFDGERLGSCDSLSVAHEYEVGTLATPGAHRLAIRVDNRMIRNVGRHAHSVTDHTQGNWNGIVGAMELVASSPVSISQVDVFPNPDRRTALLRVAIANTTGAACRIALALTADPLRVPEESEPASSSASDYEESELPVTVPLGGAVVHREVRFAADVDLWSEFSPTLVRIAVHLRTMDFDTEYVDDVNVRTGLRTVSIDDDRIAVNGAPVSLRGTLECCVFPRTGYPPTDLESWRRLFARARAYGLNHLRFHSWCPPETAFEVADEEGFYLQVEAPVWAGAGASVGTDPQFDDWLYAETERILKAYGNHPSFVMFASGNEPSGRTDEFLGQWVSSWRTRDSRRIYTSGAGWPAIPENDYDNVPAPRIQYWGAERRSRLNARPPETTMDYREICSEYGGAVVSHEIGQWCAFPNFAEMPKYTGYLKPRNFEIFRELLEENGMQDQAEAFLHASGRLQVLCYKEEIESSLRTPNLSGYQLLGVTEFPGQGTAIVGVLDAFWEEKGYCTGEEFRRFCSPTVLLARLPRRYYRVGESLQFAAEISHFGAAALDSLSVQWALVDEAGTQVRSGILEYNDQVGIGLTELGRVSTALDFPSVPGKYEVRLWTHTPDVENRWSIWVYPQTVTSDSDGVHISSSLDEQAMGTLEAGGTVLLLADPGSIATDVAIGFSPVFWNTAWTGGQAPHTLGILCDPDHPVFAEFPTASHSDWQWWELIHGSEAMMLDGLPQKLRPLVQPIDTWFHNRRLGLLFEATVSSGKIVVCSMDLRTDLENRIVARQMRSSLLRYMESGAFQPAISVSVGDLTTLFREE